MMAMDWLLESDPAIRWQVLRDIVNASVEAVEAERTRTPSEGWFARLPALQGEDGQWAGARAFRRGAGLYQVNVTVPTGVASGASVPVILTVGGISNVPVTVSIQ
jgi:hypothetical protein